MSNELLQQIDTAQRDRQTKALRDYRAVMLLRSGAPQPRDAARVQKAAAALGLTHDEIAADVAAVESLPAVEREAAELAEREAALRQIIAERERVRVQVKQLEQEELPRLQRLIEGAGHRVDQSRAARTRAADLRRRHARLFGPEA